MKTKKVSLIVSLLAVMLLNACTGLSPTPYPAAPDESPAISAPSECEHDANIQQTTRQLTVSGQGEVYLTPEIAYINIGVRSQSADVKKALDDNNAQSDSVTAALKELGVAEEDIQTTNFNIYPLQEYSPTGEIIGVSYVIENTVLVIVRSLENLGNTMDVVVQSGANTINSIRFDVTDRTSAVSEARKLAVEDARRQAQELAGAAEVELGELVAVNVYSAGSPMPMYEGGMGGGGAMMPSSGVPISAGQLVLTAEATLTYEIK